MYVQRERERFEINAGIRQGGGLSPLHFNLVTRETLRSVTNTLGGVGSKINVVSYADDVAIIADNREKQYMKLCREVENQEPPPLKSIERQFYIDEEFKYLSGAIVSKNRKEN